MARSYPARTDYRTRESTPRHETSAHIAHPPGGSPLNGGSAPEASIVRATDLTASYGDVTILQGVDLAVCSGEIVGILGDNGAGKSTLMRVIMGLHRQYTGEVQICGVSGRHLSPATLRDNGVTFLHQHISLDSHMPVWRAFFMGSELTRRIGPFRFLDGHRMRAIVRDAMMEEGLGVPFSADAPLGTLSGGQRQTVAALRACYFATRALILDEPTAGLDEHELEVVLNLVQKARSRGVAVIFVTHKEHEIYELADRFVVLKNGKVQPTDREALIQRVDSLTISSRVLAVRDIADEIRTRFSTPLGEMRGDIVELQQRYTPRENMGLFADLIETMISETDNLAAFVEHFARLTDEPVSDGSEADFESILKTVLSGVEGATEKPLSVSTEIEEGLRCMIPPYVLEHVLSNLLSNAVESQQDRADIRISASTHQNNPDYFLIVVRDWGGGIDQETISEIYNPFFTTKGANTGLGLSIVHRLLERVGGQIDVSSEVGKGSEFRVTLPKHSP